MTSTVDLGKPGAQTARPVLTVRDLRVAFRTREGGSTEVVHGIDLDVAAGQVVALVGESGSGKSVSAMSTLRLLPPSASADGTITFRPPDGSEADDVEVLTASEPVLRGLRGGLVGVVFQEPMGAWDPVYPIGKQITEALRAHDRPAGDDVVHTLLERVGIDDPPRVARSFPHQLSGGQLQRAMIAMATSCGPALLIADEPTTALDVTVQAGVLDLLRSLADDGTAILLITHDMGVVADVADEIVVLRDGKVVERGPVDEVMLHPRDEYTRDLLASVPSLHTAADVTGPDVADGDSEVRAALEHVQVVFGGRRGAGAVRAVDDVSLELHRGRTLGLVGESGSGKSTLGRALTGLIRPDAGQVRVLDGVRGATVDLTALKGRRLRAVQRQVGIVFQDPGSSLNPKHSIARSIAEPLRLAGWDARRATARVDDLLDSVGLTREMGERFPHQVSGGQRQRAAIARALALEPQVLVADEPTSALDVSVQARVLELVRRLQDDLGFACLFISHDLAVVNVVADEVAVMHHGRIVEHGPTAQVLGAPTDDYTRTLLAAAPVADPVVQRRRRDERLALAGRAR